MSTSVAKLEKKGQNGEEMFLVVDGAKNIVSYVIADPRNGNIIVKDVQDYTKKQTA